MSEAERRAIGAANEAARRAIGTNNEAARRAIGTNNEAERRAIGARITAERNGISVEDLNRLVNPATQAATLRALDKRGGVTPTRGVGVYSPPKAQNTAGIASPLTEKTKVGTVTDPATGQTLQKNIPERDYHERGLTSSDGLFVLPAIKTLNLTDANGAEVVIQLADPSGTAVQE